MASTGITDVERQEKKDQFVAYFEAVPVIKYASYYVEITEQTAHNWLKEDTVFFNRVNQAKSRWAKKRAMQTKAEFQLERLDKEIWREQRDITTNGETLNIALVEFVDGKDNE